MPVQTQIQVRRGTASSWTSTNPTLAAGEIGFETDTGKIKVGNGSSTWSALNYVGAANAIQYVYNATAGQTSFSGADSNGLTLSYTVGAEQVYVNGVLQVRGSDYTATNGTSVTLTTATIASDVVTIVAFGTFDIANTYTQAQANATFPLNSIDKSAGKNKIINGDFSVWQRGTSFSNPASAAFTADRWSVVWDGSGATRTISQQTFTAGNAITGYEPGNFFRFNQSVAGTGGTYNLFQNRMEDVRTFAGQTVTVSFWAKAASNITLPALNWEQSFGTGGSPSATTSGDFATNIAITTSWTRYTYTVTVPSISGKTVGTTTPGYLGLRIWLPVNSTFTFDIWGVQVEAGSVATSFQTATGTIQGELAACQRYYQRVDSANASDTRMNTVTMIANSTTVAYGAYIFPVRMRTSPTFGSSTASGWSLGRIAAACTAMAQERASQYSSMVKATVASGLTAGQGDWLEAGNNNTAWIEFSAEL